MCICWSDCGILSHVVSQQCQWAQRTQTEFFQVPHTMFDKCVTLFMGAKSRMPKSIKQLMSWLQKIGLALWCPRKWVSSMFGHLHHVVKEWALLLDALCGEIANQCQKELSLDWICDFLEIMEHYMAWCSNQDIHLNVGNVISKTKLCIPILISSTRIWMNHCACIASSKWGNWLQPIHILDDQVQIGQMAAHSVLSYQSTCMSWPNLCQDLPGDDKHVPPCWEHCNWQSHQLRIDLNFGGSFWCLSNWKANSSKVVLIVCSQMTMA